MVMQRISGIPISHVERLRAAGVDIPRLARAGVEIFFTQVFRDGFFHADMHPGNIFVSTDTDTRGQYVAVDFGIMGTLTDIDKNYLAQNFLAFFQRDYKRVAQAHLEAGWVPADTRIDEFENAHPRRMRAGVRPAAEGHFLRPGAAAPVPGLAPLPCRDPAAAGDAAKNPAQHRGPGRQLDPDLDLWKTAKPYLERWMSEQLGWRGFVRNVLTEAPRWANMLPQLPRLVHRALDADHVAGIEQALERLAAEQRQRHRSTIMLGVLLAALLAWHIYLCTHLERVTELPSGA